MIRFEKNENDILQVNKCFILNIKNKQDDFNYNFFKDIHFASSYFCTKKIEFTAGKGFIRIHLPLLISVSIFIAYK